MSTDGIGTLHFSDTRDVDRFVETLEKYERGELTPDEWRGFRLLHGVYMQRQNEQMMLRAKLPHGIVSSEQMRVLGEVARDYAKGRGHVTTRQNIQFYFLPIDVATKAMSRLAEVGITTREACGPSIRTVTMSPLAGLDPNELFDIRPYAEALTRHFLRGPLSASLPRKFKIGMEGDPRGSVNVAINDMSYVAVLNERGEKGFRMLVGGGTATLARAGNELVSFVAVDEFLGLSEAVIRVFHRDGDRENRPKARIKWLVRKLGWPELQARILREWEVVKRQGAPKLPTIEAAHERDASELDLAAATGTESYLKWHRTNVFAQRQPGLFAVTVVLHLGDLQPSDFDLMADLAERFGDGTLRTTVDQNLIFVNVRGRDLRTLYDELNRAGFGQHGATRLADVTSCAGAHTCSLAVTASRGLGTELIHELRRDRRATDEIDAFSRAQIKISGCPNGCGQHHIAAISLQGAMRRVGERPMPFYALSIGGSAYDPSDVRFARLVTKLPAHRVTAAVRRLIDDYEASGTSESFAEYLRNTDVRALEKRLADLATIDESTANEADFIDLGQTEPFAVEVA